LEEDVRATVNGRKVGGEGRPKRWVIPRQKKHRVFYPALRQTPLHRLLIIGHRKRTMKSCMMEIIRPTGMKDNDTMALSHQVRIGMEHRMFHL
jgi:hypothetical protein